MHSEKLPKHRTLSIKRKLEMIAVIDKNTVVRENNFPLNTAIAVEDKEVVVLLSLESVGKDPEK